MQDNLQLLFTALQISSVYILFSLGLTIIFGVLKVVNFAHGQFFTFSALVLSLALSWLAPHVGNPFVVYLLAGLAGLAACLLFGLVLYQFGFKRLERDMIGSFILSAGLVLFFEGLMLEIFGGAVRPVPALIDGNVDLLGLSVSKQRLVLFVFAVALTTLIITLLRSTKFGKALRAVAIDHEAAMLQGIAYRKIALYGFLIATGVAAIAGMLIAPVAAVTPTLGDSYLVKGFIAVVVGGMGSIVGAIFGSLLIALLESFIGFYFDPSAANLTIFVIVMLVLLIKPKGFFGND
ncbi:branched-chain amino acid ABC transporter permease [Bordetella bronchiseptica]|uniref:Branched-chain amino acid transport system permease protein n=3 Tax=Bordetella bronchiseptica TaxID=518 RepID=A0A0H3LIS8_BORBR|nr:branched-chain amino acid ABC transporter permease [Bordetella bronchiseptica]KAK60816.1 branched-chain amino acid ABC transporter, permease protein [Bordetella bronchiseptica 980-2]KCV24692.1 branched-chain amino acid ABC transporter, permease protein [Bordetella bronchiseptica 00-P-2730]KDD51756.1 branched-chain amino acid ABC transporter, permease protein [Bordetella bronchiseptica OSU553]SHQ28812.1 branched-chain amino acid ABC-type transport system [Mycobacteroides abscessus subsp. absc